MRSSCPTPTTPAIRISSSSVAAPWRAWTSAEEDGFQFRPEAVKARLNARTKAILINSPANPTGTLLSAERMAALADMGPLILSDEIYHGLVYEGREHSILEFTDRAVVFNGFSKAFAMTGWRLGLHHRPARVGPAAPEDAPELLHLRQRLRPGRGRSPPCARPCPTRSACGRSYDERRRFLVPGPADDWASASRRSRPAPSTSSPTPSASAPIRTPSPSRFLERAKVCVAPGVGFGRNGEGYLRFSYANSLENLEEALADWRGSWRRGRCRGRHCTWLRRKGVIMVSKPSASYSITMRVEIQNRPGMLGRVASAIGKAGGDIGAVDIAGFGSGHDHPGLHGERPGRGPRAG